jgi:hypothetical protein
MAKTNKAQKNLSETYRNQINVLNVLSRNPVIPTEPKQYMLNEIADLSGLKDEKETQRYLFILEGQKLVAPFPAGDFTSKTWHITKDGMKAVKNISRAMN